MVPAGSSSGNGCSWADYALLAAGLNPEELHLDGKTTGEVKMWPPGFIL